MADNTASLVVALSAQLTKFESDMKKAGIIADQSVSDIEKKFSSMNPQISTSFFGNLFANLATKGLDAATEGMKQLIDRMVELQKTAEYTETSMSWLYGLQQASKAGGASLEQVNVAIRSVAAALDQMQRGAGGPLKNLFDFNPQALKGINVDALTLSQTLDLVAKLMRNAKTEVSAIEIGKQLGVPEDVVKSWETYGANLSGAVAKAKAGAPDLDRIAEETKAVNEAWKKFVSELGTAAIDAAYASMTKLGAATAALAEAQKGSAEWLASMLKGVPLLGTAAEEAVEASKQYAKAVEAAKQAQGATFAERFGALPAKPGDESRPNRQGDDTTNVPRPPPPAATITAYDREVNAINKQIAVMQAEAETVGETVDKQESYRVSLVLIEKATQSTIPITTELNDKINAQAEAAGQAKLALAEHTFAMAKMTSASQTFGSALSTAFTDAIVDGKKFGDVMTSLVSTLEKAALNSLVMSFFTAPSGGGKSIFQTALGFAGGTDFAPGGMAVVGEHGPELVNLPRGSQVIPNDVARGMGGGGGSIVYSPAIDARGASVEAVARLAQIMEQDRATFAARTVATIQQARRGRVVGL